jgi:hypothetical protein
LQIKTTIIAMINLNPKESQMTKDTKTNETEIKLKDEVLQMAEKIEKGLKLDNKTGIASSEDNLYESLLPEDLTIETVKAVSAHNSNFIAAGTYAFGNVAINAMAKHKDLEKASAEIKMAGRDVLNLNIDRSKNYTDHLHGSGETTKYGVVTASYDVRAGKNSGELKKARAAIADLAMEKLGK